MSNGQNRAQPSKDFGAQDFHRRYNELTFSRIHDIINNEAVDSLEKKKTHCYVDVVVVVIVYYINWISTIVYTNVVSRSRIYVCLSRNKNRNLTRSEIGPAIGRTRAFRDVDFTTLCFSCNADAFCELST